jgi:hypothetical protein
VVDISQDGACNGIGTPWIDNRPIKQRYKPGDIQTTKQDRETLPSLHRPSSTTVMCLETGEVASLDARYLPADRDHQVLRRIMCELLVAEVEYVVQQARFNQAQE